MYSRFRIKTILHRQRVREAADIPEGPGRCIDILNSIPSDSPKAKEIKQYLKDNYPLSYSLWQTQELN